MTDVLPLAADVTPSFVIEALAVSAAFGAVALFLRTVSLSGFVAGVVVGAAIYVGLGRPGFALLALFFLAGSAVTRIGYKRKAELNAAQAGGGARSAVNVVAKGLVPVACAVLALCLDRPEWALVAFVAALAAGLGDTVATELGTLVGRRYWLVPSFRRAAAGTPGAVSVEGTLLGCAAAAAVGAAAAAVDFMPWPALWAIVVANLIAGLDESLSRRLVGGCVPPRWRGPALNFDLTVTAALVAGLLWRFVGRG